MYKIHRDTISRLSKLRNKLQQVQHENKILKDLYKNSMFEEIENNLNNVSKSFISAQLRNVNKPPSARRWTVED